MSEVTNTGVGDGSSFSFEVPNSADTYNLMSEVSNTGGGGGDGSSLLEQEVPHTHPSSLSSSSSTAALAPSLYQMAILQQWEKDQSFLVGLIAAGVSLLLLMCCCACSYRMKFRYKKKQDQKRVFAIFQSLTQFDVDDFDLRRSPTGGFHATYLNGLADGVIKRKSLSIEEDDEEDDDEEESTHTDDGEMKAHKVTLSKRV